MSKKVRIIERTMPDGRVEFTIQERHFLFFWWWVDAWVNHDVSTRDSFPTLAEAQKNLCYFDGTKCREVVVQKKSKKTLFTEEDLRQAIKMARETEYPLAKGMEEIIEIIKKNK